jgi:hypothetical protein
MLRGSQRRRLICGHICARSLASKGFDQSSKLSSSPDSKRIGVKNNYYRSKLGNELSSFSEYNKAWFEFGDADDSKKLKLEIVNLCSGGYISEEKVNFFIARRLKDCHNLEISQLLHLLGKKSRNVHNRLLKSHLPAMACQLQKLSVNNWSFIDIASIVYGLQSLDESEDGVIDIISIMTKAAIATLKTEMRPKPSNISMIIIGLQKNRLQTESSREFVSVLSSIVQKRTISFGSQAIGNSIYGLKGMSSDIPEVRVLVTALTAAVESSIDVLSAQETCNAFYGLQGMSSDHIEVRGLLCALLPKIKSCSEHFDSQDIGNTLYGLQGMSSEYPEVRDILRALLPKVKSCLKSFKSQEIANSLYGLQKMSSDYSEVRAIIGALTPRLRDCQDVMSNQEISNSFYGLRGMKSNHPEVLALVSALTVRARECEGVITAGSPTHFTATSSLSEMKDNKSVSRIRGLNSTVRGMSTVEMSNALYGMQKLSSDYQEVRNAVSALTSLTRSCTDRFLARDVSSALYGMKSMKSDCREVRDLVAALTPIVRRSREDLSPQNLGNSIMGLQGMCSSSAVVAGMLSALTPKVVNCKGRLGAQELCNALYGMRRMNSETAAVRTLLTALVPKIHGCTDMLSAQGVGMALYGLQRMNSDCLEVREVLSSLEPLLKKFDGDLTAHSVSNALYGLKAMNTNSMEVRAILAALVPQMRNLSYLDVQGVGNAFYGLQGMSSNCAEVHHILAVLLPKVQCVQDSLDAHAIGNSLYGLRGMGDIGDVQSLLDRLYYHLEALCKKSENFRELPATDVIHLAQNFTLVLPDLRHSLGIKYEHWEGMRRLLIDVLSDIRTEERASHSPRRPQSPAESKVFTAARRAAGHFIGSVTSNGHLFDLFEADVIIAVRRKSGGIDLVNIEVDGDSHLHEKTKLFTSLRDKYLLNRGVRIVRLDTRTLWKMNDTDLEMWVRKIADPELEILPSSHKEPKSILLDAL